MNSRNPRPFTNVTILVIDLTGGTPSSDYEKSLLSLKKRSPGSALQRHELQLIPRLQDERPELSSPASVVLAGNRQDAHHLYIYVCH